MTTNQYCDEFSDSSRYVFNWLNAQPSVGEESITDWLLFDLSQSLPNLRYKKFTHREEARKTGADWEWWFVDNNAALSMRIQAKRLDATGDNYNGLAYTNKHGLQIEKLLSDSDQSGFLPLYALYFSDANNPKVLCGGKPDASDRQGVYIASAQDLYDRFILGGRKRVNASDIIERSNPLHCLACCPKSGNSVRAMYHYLSDYYGESLRSSNPNIPQLGLHDQAAPYVISLLKSEGTEVPDWWEGEFQRSFAEINALVVLDLRNF